MNHNGVTSGRHLDHAQGYLDASRAAQDGLRDAYSGDLRDNNRIASLHQAINYGLKAGEVSALIGIGEQLEKIAAILDATSGPSSVPIDGLEVRS